MHFAGSRKEEPVSPTDGTLVNLSEGTDPAFPRRRLADVLTVSPDPTRDPAIAPAKSPHPVLLHQPGFGSSLPQPAMNPGRVPFRLYASRQ